ncbi:MAG TPA: FUSC family protein [Candidatus Binatia bacterium]|nr:FUSC family protein [Candidatus Binatia bacterium]
MTGTAAAPAAGWIARWRAELAPTPGRWREAFIVALGPTIAIAIAVTVQLPGFLSATIAYFALQRKIVCSWRNLPRRLFVTAATAIAIVPLGGVVLPLPWLVLPAFFALVATTLYVFPLPRRPVEGACILFVAVVFTYAAIFDPLAMGALARDAACEIAIGVVVATLIAETFATVRPRTRLAAALTESFARNRTRFRAAIARYRAPDAAALAREARDVPAYSTLSAHLDLLDQVRQEGVAHEDERTMVALATAAERCESYVSTLDFLAREDVGRRYRALLADELSRLADAIEGGLAAFEAAARRLADRSERPHADPSADATTSWPDVGALVRALESRQLAVRRAGLLEGVDASEATNANGTVRALAGLADVLHTGPHELEQMARGGDDAAALDRAPRAWPKLPRLDPLDARYAAHGGLATALCLLIGLATNLPQLATVLWNPILIVQSSYGATLRRAGLRCVGVVAGALLGIGAIIVFMPNTNDVATYLVVTFAVALGSHYVALGSPDTWYAGFQTAITFFIVTYGLSPAVDVHVALWRAWGTILGTAVLLAVYRGVAPDYAGRQLVARFRDLLRTTLDLLPRSDAPAAPLAVQIPRRMEVGRAVADLLRLADEARFEGRQGIDVTASVDATGIAMRVAYRAGLVARARAVAPLPALDPEFAARLAAVEDGTRAWVEILLAMVEARQTMARPEALRHRRARERAAAHLPRARPDVAAAVGELEAHLETTHFAALADVPAHTSGELLSSIGHYRRIAELLPRLDDALARAILPGHPACERAGSDPPTPEPVRGLAA